MLLTSCTSLSGVLFHSSKRAWTNSLRVVGWMFLSLIARPNCSNTCSIGLRCSEQVSSGRSDILVSGHHVLMSRGIVILVRCANIPRANGRISDPVAVSTYHHISIEDDQLTFPSAQIAPQTWTGPPPPGTLVVHTHLLDVLQTVCGHIAYDLLEIAEVDSSPNMTWRQCWTGSFGADGPKQNGPFYVCWSVLEKTLQTHCHQPTIHSSEVWIFVPGPFCPQSITGLIASDEVICQAWSSLCTDTWTPGGLPWIQTSCLSVSFQDPTDCFTCYPYTFSNISLGHASFSIGKDAITLSYTSWPWHVAAAI